MLSDFLSASRFVVVVVYSARDKFNQHSPEELRWKIFAVEDFPWRIFVMISSDQCRTVKGDLRNMFNVVGTFVLRAEEF